MSQELENKAKVIRNETKEGANDTIRVGDWMVLASEEIDSKFTSGGYTGTAQDLANKASSGNNISLLSVYLNKYSRENKLSLIFSNGYYSGNGNIVSSSSWRYTQKITITTDILIVSVMGHVNRDIIAAILFFDKNGQPIESSEFPCFSYDAENDYCEYIFVVSSFNAPASAETFTLSGAWNKTGAYVSGVNVYKYEQNSDIITDINAPAESRIVDENKNSYLKADGTLGSSNGYYVSGKQEVQHGDVFVMHTKGYNTCAYCLYDSQDNVIAYAYNGLNQDYHDNVLRVFQNNASYVRFSRDSNNYYIYKLGKNLLDFIRDEIETTLNDAKKYTDNKNVGESPIETREDFEYETIIDTYLVFGNSGQTAINKLYQITGEIPIKSGDGFSYSLGAYNSNIYTIFDKDNTVLSYKGYGPGGTGMLFTEDLYINQDLIDEGASKIVFCSRKADGMQIRKIVTKTIEETITGIRNDIEETNNDVSDISAVNIVCDGDSLTYGEGGDGTTYVGVLSSLIQQRTAMRYNILNYGSPGDNTLMILARMGVISLVVKEPFTIPATVQETSPFKIWYGYDTVRLANTPQGQYIWPNYFVGLSNPVTINGIEGILAGKPKTTGETPDYYPYSFKRTVAGFASDVKVNTQIATKCGKYLNSFHILFMGMNGGFKAGVNNSAITAEDVDEYMKQCKLADSYCKGNIIYMTPQLAKSSNNYINDDIEDRMLSRFGNRYINLRRYYSTIAIQDAKNKGLLSPDYVPTDEDNSAMNNGNCPPVLLAPDKLHFNSIGYVLLGNLVFQRLLDLGIVK